MRWQQLILFYITEHYNLRDNISYTTYFIIYLHLTWIWSSFHDYQLVLDVSHCLVFSFHSTTPFQHRHDSDDWQEGLAWKQTFEVEAVLLKRKRQRKACQWAAVGNGDDFGGLVGNDNDQFPGKTE